MGKRIIGVLRKLVNYLLKLCRFRQGGLSIVAAIAFVFLITCNEERSLKEGSGSAAPTGASASLLDLTEVPKTVEFPHPPGFDAIDQHGLLGLVGKGELCTSCHGKDLSGGSSGVACTECHENYPHNTWKAESDHIAAAQQALASNSNECSVCHSNALHDQLENTIFEDLKPENCSSCHNYPHPKSYSSPKADVFHGLAVQKQGLEECKTCHGEDFLGKGVEEKSCFACHNYPHPPKKQMIADHGSLFLTLAGQDCLGCHEKQKADKGDLGAAEYAAPQCQSCHSYPHPDAFAHPEFHGQLVIDHGLEKAKCLNCHESSASVAQNGIPACNQCHAFPHPENWVKRLQNAAPEAAGIGEKQNLSHGEYLLGLNQTEERACLGCHTQKAPQHPADINGAGADEAVGPMSVASCGDCHASYPHENNWIQGRKHGKLVLEKGIGNLQCGVCHENQQTVAGQAGTGQTTGISDLGTSHQPGDVSKPCQTCHLSYPHEPQWIKGQKHGPFIRQLGGVSEARCDTCHDLNKPLFPSNSNSETGGENSSENPLLSLAPSTDHKVGCKDGSCHQSYPHTQEFIEKGGIHGANLYKKNQVLESECTMCHGPELQGTESAPACTTCHASFPPHHRWPGFDHETAGLKGTGGTIGERDCKMCHLGEDYSGLPEHSLRNEKKCGGCHGTVKFRIDGEEKKFYIYPHVNAFKNFSLAGDDPYQHHKTMLLKDIDDPSTEEGKKKLAQEIYDTCADSCHIANFAGSAEAFPSKDCYGSCHSPSKIPNPCDPIYEVDDLEGCEGFTP